MQVAEDKHIKIIEELVFQTQMNIPEDWNVGFGGCAVYAVMLGEMLEKELGIKPEYCYLTYDKADGVIKEANERYKNEGKIIPYNEFRKNAICHHVVLKVGDSYFDHERISNDLEDFGCFLVAYSIERDILKSWANKADNWNEDFNRRRIGPIKKKLQNIILFL